MPRRYRSTVEVALEGRRTASSEPASSAATVLSIVSCLRAKFSRTAWLPACRRLVRRPSASAPSSRRPPRMPTGARLLDRSGDHLTSQAPRRRAAREEYPSISSPRPLRCRPGRTDRPRGGASAASRRRLRSRWSAATSSPLPSFSSACSASTSMRSCPTGSRSPAFIAVFTSSSTCSRMLTPRRMRARRRRRRRSRAERTCPAPPPIGLRRRPGGSTIVSDASGARPRPANGACAATRDEEDAGRGPSRTASSSPARPEVRDEVDRQPGGRAEQPSNRRRVQPRRERASRRGPRSQRSRKPPSARVLTPSRGDQGSDNVQRPSAIMS